MPSPPRFAYKALNFSRREIRLVELLPDFGANDDFITCRFHCRSLDEDPEYIALSYMWKDSTADGEKAIMLDGTRFRVFENLWQFLRRARDYGYRFLWIDAISIDQRNTVERNHQVGLMRHIYSKAAQTAVWLGMSASHSDSAIDRLNRKATKKRKRNSITDPTWTSEEAKGLLSLFQRRYWRRIWIVQEVILAKNLMIHCGDKSVSGHKLNALFDNLEEVNALNQISSARQVLRSPAARVILQRKEWQSFRNKQSGFKLFHLLEEYKHMESTEKIDKVYALLSLVSDDDLRTLKIKADYSKHWKDISRLLTISSYARTRAQSEHLVILMNTVFKDAYS